MGSYADMSSAIYGTPPVNPDEYQGFTNRETWVISLMVDNTPFLHSEFQVLLLDSTDQEAANDLEVLIRESDFFSDALRAGFLADFVNAGMARVNWLELVQNGCEV